MAGTGTSPSIPLFDLRVEAEDLAAVEAVLRSGDLEAGREVAAFERDFATKVGCRHAVLLSSCTAALHLSYLTAGVGPGDEVIVPSYTFAATAASAYACGATPVFADVVGEHDLSLDPADVEARITPRTKAVCAVHFGGYLAPVAELQALCEARGLVYLEDSAHAPLTPPHGLSASYSFFSNKVLSAGEGGLLGTDDDAVADAARAHRERLGYRLDDVRAAWVRSRLGRIDEDVAARRALTDRYRRLLAGVDGVSVPYPDEAVASSACYVMPVLLDDAARQVPVREALRDAHGVQTSLLYPPVHRFTAYVERLGELSLPRTEDASDRELTLPLFPHMTHDEQDRVVAALRTELAA
jgi:dTDP-4-amino-4,6-dideoxygalactose transaminase